MKQVPKGANASRSLEKLSVGRSFGKTGSPAGSLTVSQAKRSPEAPECCSPGKDLVAPGVMKHKVSLFPLHFNQDSPQSQSADSKCFQSTWELKSKAPHRERIDRTSGQLRGGALKVRWATISWSTWQTVTQSLGMFVPKQVMIFSLLTPVKDFLLPDSRLQVTLGTRGQPGSGTGHAQSRQNLSVLSWRFQQPAFPLGVSGRHSLGACGKYADSAISKPTGKEPRV